MELAMALRDGILEESMYQAWRLAWIESRKKLAEAP